MNVREVDGAGVDVEENHGNALPLQRWEHAKVDYAGLEAVDRGIRVGATKVEDEVLGIKHSDVLLNETFSRRYRWIGG